MKSEIERRRHRRAVNTLGRSVLTTLGPMESNLRTADAELPASTAAASADKRRIILGAVLGMIAGIMPAQAPTIPPNSGHEEVARR
jgi:hypothetical protein